MTEASIVFDTLDVGDRRRFEPGREWSIGCRIGGPGGQGHGKVVM
jgi:hypothetical protein